jgi:hypothetical protein
MSFANPDMCPSTKLKQLVDCGQARGGRGSMR